MHALVTVADFRKVSGLKSNLLANGIMHFAGIHKLNDLYASLLPYNDLDFTSAFFAQSNINLEVDGNELARIPKSGPFITVSNHPYGGIDGLALLELIGRRRKDYKIMANFLLKKIEPISEYFVGVNPFETHKHVASSVAGMKYARQHLSGEKPLGIFPAGEVSTYQRNVKSVLDREWQSPALKLIKKASVPVIPVYFHGCNTWSFHMLGKIHPMLRTLRLPHELTLRKKRTIRVRIGTPVTVEEQNTFTEVNELGRYLRTRTYALGSPFEEKKNVVIPFITARKQVTVRRGIDDAVIAAEINSLHQKKILSQGNFDLYLAPSDMIPNILLEIGRLREITFRHAGEGTNKALDLDKFDSFYEHLFLYDHVSGELVGAYRIGKGSDIVSRYGCKGFYINTLFRMKQDFVPILEKSIELGRSFIRAEYQNKRLPLFLLWRGILNVLQSTPQCRYVIGPVSISNAYSSVSKSVLVAFIKRYYFDQKLSTYISPRKEYTLDDTILQEAASLLDPSGNDLKKLDEIIDDIEPAIKSAPVLLKKYIKQNARIIGFNVDPAFNQALDGLMILDVKDVPKETIGHLKSNL